MTGKPMRFQSHSNRAGSSSVGDAEDASNRSHARPAIRQMHSANPLCCPSEQLAPGRWRRRLWRGQKRLAIDGLFPNFLQTFFIADKRICETWKNGDRTAGKSVHLGSDARTVRRHCAGIRLERGQIREGFQSGGIQYLSDRVMTNGVD